MGEAWAVRWIDHDGLILEPSEIEDYIINLKPYDEAAGDLPPQSFGLQEWRTSPEYQGLAVVKNRCLHPDRLVALFDNDNSLYDAYELKCKPKRKEKGYAASSRGDTSGRDFKLAMGAVKAGFSNQEIADLLIGCRAHNGNDFKRRDYYLRTICRAREDAKRANPAFEDEGPPGGGQQPPPPPEGQADEEILNSIPQEIRADVADDALLLSKLKRARNFALQPRRIMDGELRSVHLITQVQSDPPEYGFHLSDGNKVVINSEATLHDTEVLQQAFLRQGYFIPPRTPAEWREFRVPLAKAIVQISAPAGMTKEGELSEYINNFCREIRLVFSKQDLAKLPGSPLKEGDRILVPIKAFMQWLKVNYNGVNWTLNEFAKRYSDLGYKRLRIQVRGQLDIFMILVPEDVLDINDIVDAQERKTNIRNKAREEEGIYVQ